MYGIIGLLLLLVAVLTIEVYRATEGFTVATPAPTPTPATPTPATPAPTATTPTPATPAPAPTATTPMPATPVPAPTATATTSTPTPATTIATSPMDALALNTQDRAKFIRDVQDIVRTELLATKQITTANAQPVLCGSANAPTATGQISEQQGREAVTAREKACPKDMSEYIRKDSIPCWNCTLDY